MKKSFIQTLIVVVTLMLSFNVFANNGPNEKVKAATDSLRKEVTQLVSDADLWGNGIDEEEVIVRFTINKAGEVQLQDVVTENDYLKTYVNQHVNNRKVNTNGVPTETSYYLKINFKAR